MDRTERQIAIMRFAAVIAAGLVLVAAASAATAPDGFFEGTQLERAASFVAGKPATIYCANNTQAWDAWIQSVYGDIAPSAYTPTIGGSESEFAPAICRVLINRLNRWPVSTYNLAASILYLTHESQHQRGVKDEGQAECQAIHLMPRVAVKFFHVKAGKELRAVMAQAWKSHRATPPAYQAVC